MKPTLFIFSDRMPYLPPRGLISGRFGTAVTIVETPWRHGLRDAVIKHLMDYPAISRVRVGAHMPCFTCFGSSREARAELRMHEAEKEVQEAMNSPPDIVVVGFHHVEGLWTRIKAFDQSIRAGCTTDATEAAAAALSGEFDSIAVKERLSVVIHRMTNAFGPIRMDLELALMQIGKGHEEEAGKLINRAQAALPVAMDEARKLAEACERIFARNITALATVKDLESQVASGPSLDGFTGDLQRDAHKNVIAFQEWYGELQKILVRLRKGVTQ